MKTVTFSAIKGGVGKSSMAILAANILAAANKKVLCIFGAYHLSGYKSRHYLHGPQKYRNSL